MKKIQLLLAVAVTCMLAFIACSSSSSSSSSSNSPKGVVEKFYDNVMAGKFEKAIEVFDLEAEAKKGYTSDIKAFIANHCKQMYATRPAISKYEIVSVETICEKQGEEDAEVLVKLFYKNGTTEEEMVYTRKDKRGEWKIGAFPEEPESWD